MKNIATIHLIRIQIFPSSESIASCLTVTIWRLSPPLARMTKNCRRWLKIIGVNKLSDVLKAELSLSYTAEVESHKRRLLL
jgi:hypothetical protein